MFPEFLENSENKTSEYVGCSFIKVLRGKFLALNKIKIEELCCAM